MEMSKQGNSTVVKVEGLSLTRTVRNTKVYNRNRITEVLKLVHDGGKINRLRKTVERNKFIAIA